jgi:amidophosphoribosyltransferase
VRDVEPGELVVVSGQGVRSLKPFPPARLSHCIFEHVYFARPDSLVFGRNVLESRLLLGRQLAREAPADADVVVPVPDSGMGAALGYAQESGLPFEWGLIRNHYVGRTFIEPKQSIRSFGVKIKLNPVRSVLAGRRVALIDDSIVRGTTIHEIVQMARDSGANKVMVASAAPPVRFPNVYGIDMPTRSELIAASRSEEEIRREIGADALVYQKIDDLKRAIRDCNPQLTNFEASCFDGVYITGDVTPAYLDRIERARLAPQVPDDNQRAQLSLAIEPADA